MEHSDISSVFNITVSKVLDRIIWFLVQKKKRQQLCAINEHVENLEPKFVMIT